MTNQTPRLEDVFGISPNPILSYYARPRVDGSFQEALRTQKHIVIYGSSKQGKTSLRQKHIPENGFITVNCSPRNATEDIFSSILRQAQVTLQKSECVTNHRKGGAKAKTGFKAMLPFLGGGDAEAEVSGEAGRSTTLHREFVDFDRGDAQPICEILSATKFHKYIVLENFHYLSSETQTALAPHLKTFHEYSIRFVILGVWKEANLLEKINPDLVGRITEIPVEPWEEDDFDHVIQRGCEILNIRIAPKIRQLFREDAYGNVGMLQEYLRKFCGLSGISRQQMQCTELSDRENADQAIHEELVAQQGQLKKVLRGIAAKSRTRDTDDPLVLPYYLVKVILTAPIQELKKGLMQRDLLEKIQALHYREDKTTIRPSDISYLMSRIPYLQVDMLSPFLYYDNNLKRLKIVDNRHFFVLEKSNRAEFIDEIPVPIPECSV